MGQGWKEIYISVTRQATMGKAGIIVEKGYSQMESLSSDELNQFPPDFRVWVVLDKATPDTYLLFPKDLLNELGVFAFLEKQDAEHMVRLLKEYGKQYTDMELGISHDLLRDLGIRSAASKTPLAVLNSENAMDYFSRFVNMLDRYYGYNP
jgi:hypothetical protein